MSNTMPENEFGPNIEFREYSFLQNQHAAALNASVLTLDICQVQVGHACTVQPAYAALTPHCSCYPQDASTCADGADKLKPQLHEEALKAALTEGKVAEAKVGALSRVVNIVGARGSALLMDMLPSTTTCLSSGCRCCTLWGVLSGYLAAGQTRQLGSGSSGGWTAMAPSGAA